MGLGREAMLVTGGQFLGSKNAPGPGQYNTRDVNKTKISFTFRPKTSLDNMLTSSKTPGPGSYTSIDATNNSGKYVVSTHNNSRAPRFNPPTAKGGLKMSNEPGPGNYQYSKVTDINKTGSYFVSKFRSNLARSFGGSPRKTGQLGYFENTPGPGNYRLPSDFGEYKPMKSQSLFRNQSS